MTIDGLTFVACVKSVLAFHNFGSDKVVPGICEEEYTALRNKVRIMFKGTVEHENDKREIPITGKSWKWIKVCEMNNRAYDAILKSKEKLIEMGYLRKVTKKVKGGGYVSCIGVTPKGWGVAKRYLKKAQAGSK